MTVHDDLATLRDWIGDPEDYSDEDRGAAERACDACDGVEAELSRLRETIRERDAEADRNREVIRAAEARCARQQQALREMEAAALKAAQLLPMTLSTSVEADHRSDHPSWAGWLLRHKVLPVAREALAGPDTPADSQEDRA